MKKLLLLLILAITLQANGQSNYSLNLSQASSQYVAISDPGTGSVLDLQTSFTIEAWVYETDAFNNTVIDKGNYGYLFILHNDGNGGSGNEIGFYNSPTGWKGSSGANLQINTWYHVAITVGSGLIKFYVNGSLISTASGYNNVSPDNNPVNIGRQGPNNCFCNHFNGKMDELRIWSTTRTQSEIRANMYNSVKSNASGLVAYYKFDEGTGSTVIDATSNGNNGTLINSPTWSPSSVNMAVNNPGNALYFDGSTDNVSVSYKSSLDLSSGGQLTMEMWLYPTGAGNIVTRTGYGYGLWNDWDGSINFWDQGSQGSTIKSGLYCTMNAWNHVAVTVQDMGSYLNIYFYINGKTSGVQTSSQAQINNGTAGGTLDFGVQDRATCNCNHYGGMIDEFRLWNVVRTQAQINANMIGVIDPTSSNLVAYYRFDEGIASGTNTSLTSLVDLTTASSTGTLNTFSLSGSSSNWVASNAFNTWTGNSNTTWSTAGNWGLGAAPGSSNFVNIPSTSEASNQPTLDGNKTIGGINNSGIVTIGANTLTINGNASGTGTLKGSTSSNLTLGADVGTLYFDQTTPGTTNVIHNLVIGSGSAASVTLGNALNIDPTGSVTFNAAGTKSLTTGGFLTLKSSASGTAYIGNTNSATISGNLSVERYLPATGRKYRFLASPVVGATSSYWRNNGVNTAGVGIQITGSGSNFDASTSNNPSAFSYNEVNAGSNTSVGNGASVDAGWTAFTDGNSTALTNGKGFRVLVRGDRTLSLTTSPAPAANTTTISVTGTYPSSPVTINTTKTAANANSGYNLVGNPYPCAIDWNAITKTNVSATYYVYSPSTSSYQSWNGATGGATQYISSGQAFLVLNTAASGSLSIAESHKTTGAGAALFKGNLTNHLRVALKYDNSTSDEVFIHFREDATEGQDDFDAPKLINASVNFASMGVDNKRYSINCLPALTSDREVALSVLGSVQANYSIILNDVSTFDGYKVFLVDNYLHTNTQVSNGFSYPVQLTADSASFKDGRFKVVFTKSATGISATAASQRSIIAYPNPVENVLNIDLNGTNNASYMVYNQLGEVVLAGTFMQEKNALNTSNLSNGVYFIKVQNSNVAQTIKFIK